MCPFQEFDNVDLCRECDFWRSKENTRSSSCIRFLNKNRPQSGDRYTLASARSLSAYFWFFKKIV